MFETYTIKPEKIVEFAEYLKKYLVWLEKRRPTLYKEVKSHQMLSHMFGGKFGEYMEVWEYKNMAECEKCWNRLMQDEELNKNVFPEFAVFMVPGTHSINIWNAETEKK